MTMTATQTEIVVPEFGPEGPTGRFLEVVEAAAVDYGDNELGRFRRAAGLNPISLRNLHKAYRLKAIRTNGEPRCDLVGKIVCDY